MAQNVDRDNRDAVRAYLMTIGNRPEKASLYADVYAEYRIAQKNIRELGAVVSDGRTGAAAANPYQASNDKAFSKLEILHKAGVKTGELWN